jgi:hypothetical protein
MRAKRASHCTSGGWLVVNQCATNLSGVDGAQRGPSRCNHVRDRICQSENVGLILEKGTHGKHSNLCLCYEHSHKVGVLAMQLRRYKGTGVGRPGATGRSVPTGRLGTHVLPESESLFP